MSVARHLDAMEQPQAAEALQRCCGADRWVQGMLQRRPFRTDEALFAAADEVWATMERDDVLQALAHHPEIGTDLDALRRKFASTAAWSQGEQAAVAQADETTLHALREHNVAYKKRFGHIFVVCATGKSAAQMLELLRQRIDNDPDQELRIAAAEQAKITRLRLEKLAP